MNAAPQEAQPNENTQRTQPQSAATRLSDTPPGTPTTQRVGPEQAVEEATAGNIDKIRNIIFGDQMRGYEKKFKRLEERLNQELTDLREETRRHFTSLETHISREFDSLVNRLRTEQDERTQSVQELQKELKTLSQDLDQKLTRLDNSANETQRELRQQILDQSKSLRDELRQKYQEMAVALENESQDLASSKVSRASLAGLLTEVAMQLNSDLDEDDA